MALIEGVTYSNIIWGLMHHPKNFQPCIFLVAKALGTYFFRIPFVFGVINESKKAMVTHMEALEKELSDGREWLVGEFTLADIGMAPVFNRMELAGWAFIYADMPNVCKYWKRLQERPTFKKAIVDEELTTTTLSA